MENEDYEDTHESLLKTKDDRYFMGLALLEARKALAIEEVPVGAVVVHEGRVIGKGHNQKELLKDPTAHAEMIAITGASAYLGTWRLIETTIYVTLEPCPMCAGAIVMARIKRVVFAACDSKAGACGTLFQIVRDERLNHQVEITSGIREEESKAILQSFFKKKRKAEN